MNGNLTLLNMTKNRLTVDQKKIINNERTVDCNQLVPIKYQWA